MSDEQFRLEPPDHVIVDLDGYLMVESLTNTQINRSRILIYYSFHRFFDALWALLFVSS